MGIGRILGGALTGYGAGLVQSSVMADEERRQVALEKLRQENRTAEIETTANFNDRNASRSDARGDFNAARQVQRTTAATQVVDNNKFKQTLTLEQIGQANKLDQLRLQSSLNMTETQAKAALDLSNAATAAGLEVGNSEIAADGSMVQYAKNGKFIGQSKPGVFTPPSSGSSGGNAFVPQAGSTAPKAPAAQPAVKPPAVKKAPPTIIRFDKNMNIVK